MEKYDVIIIGAGPAGNVAAILCARSGLRTLIIERNILPREKVCGGGLTFKTIQILREVGCEKEFNLEKTCNSVKIHLCSVDKSYLIESKNIYMGTVKRSMFDLSLAEYAKNLGADIKTNERFISFEQYHSGKLKINTSKTNYQTEILIGADGAISRVRHQLQKEYPQLFHPLNYLVGSNIDIPINEINLIEPKYAHLFFNFSEKIDYGWAFPKENIFNIGIGYKLDKFSKKDNNIEIMSFANKSIRRINESVEVNIAVLPIFWEKSAPNIQWGKILLVGDAAGFVDEWTGEGIYYGIKSSIHAYEAIKKYFHRREDNNILHKYTRLCKNDFFTNLMFAHYFAALFRSRPRGYNYLSIKQLRNLFIPFASGDLSYRRAVIMSIPYIIKNKYLKLPSKWKYDDSIEH